MNILIIKTSSLGDIVHALPVLQYLRRVAPQAQVDWLVDEAFANVLTLHPAVSQLLVVPLRRWKKAPLALSTWRGLRAFVRRLRGRHYDLVFDLQGNTKSALLCAATRGTRKVGFAARNLQEPLARWVTNEKVEFEPTDRHAVQRYLRVVAGAFDATPDALRDRASIAVAESDTRAAAALLADAPRPRIALHCGTSWASKLWSEDGWVELGRGLLAHGLAGALLLSWGDEAERERAERIASRIGEGARLLPRLDLKRLCAVFEACELMLGADTGPVHLAAAAGTSTVSIYRCTDGTRNGPFGPSHRIVQAPLDCSKCWGGTCWRDVECTGSIRPDAVLQAARELLESGPTPRPES